MKIENRDSFLKQDQMEEDLEEDPGLHRRDGEESMAELKRMAEERKKWKSFTEDPPTLISN